jgi:sulfur transfer complex TusBCD TusB component (DsrH family)
MTILLTEDAVNYAVRGQEGTGIKIAGAPVQPGFLIETDVRSVQDARIPVYALREDLAERGIREDELITGVETLPRREFGKLVDRFDTVWNW